MYIVFMFVVVGQIHSVINGIQADATYMPGLAFRATKSKMSRGGRLCRDFCAVMPFSCQNGGTCMTDEVTCEGKCLCTQGWTGQWCKQPLLGSMVHTQSPNVTDTSQINNESKLQKVSKHGIRNTEQTIVAEHSSLNTNHSLAKTNVNSSTIGPGSSGGAELELCQQRCKDGDCYKVYEGYICKARVPSSNTGTTKVCGPGFECEHGICDTDALAENIYRCICDSNYVGQFCTLECPLDCGPHGICDYHVPDKTYKCFCQWNYTGLNCSELFIEDEDTFMVPESVVFHWYVVGISIATVVTFLVTMVFGAYFMWRKRLVFMLKIVHYFQHYEDDDGKEYDAFISYKSTPEDEAFVLQQLFPRLETQLNFKLCLHFRDFVPGEAIANNIVRAIESSRRTILVVSPAYVKSEWCRMEYQKAQHEMLKLKQRIIPIVLQNVTDSTNMDKNLKSILNSVTYLEWPGLDNTKRQDKFWKKLELSMPKRSSNSSNYLESNSNTLISSASSASSSETLSNTAKNNSEKSSEKETKLPLNRTNSSPIISGGVKSKRKDLRHFMDKLVKNKLFMKRQDSSSSQAALVDEETAGSRCSYDSVSESVFTESSESTCSTPVTAHTYLDEVNECREAADNVFFSECSRSLDRRKENRKQTCEKDHCEGDKDCSACINLQKGQTSDGTFVNIGFCLDEDEEDVDCRYCKRSDFNRVRMCALARDRLKVERLAVEDVDRCMYCDGRPPLQRQSLYRGSMKQRKDAANMELLKRKRVGSLPRNFKRTSELANKDVSREINIIDNTRSSPDDTLGHLYIDVCEDV